MVSLLHYISAVKQREKLDANTLINRKIYQNGCVMHNSQSPQDMCTRAHTHMSASPLLMHPKHKLSELLQLQSGAVYQGNYNTNRVGGG